MGLVGSIVSEVNGKGIRMVRDGGLIVGGV